MITRRDFLKKAGKAGIALAVSPSILIPACGVQEQKKQQSKLSEGENISRETDHILDSYIIAKNLITSKIVDSYEPELADLVNETYKSGYGNDLHEAGITFLTPEEFIAQPNLPAGVVGFTKGQQIYILKGKAYTITVKTIFHEIGHTYMPGASEFNSVLSELKLSTDMYTKTELGTFDQKPEYKQLLAEMGYDTYADLWRIWNGTDNPLIYSAFSLRFHRVAHDNFENHDITKYNQARAVISSHLSKGKKLDDISTYMESRSDQDLYAEADEIRALDDASDRTMLEAAYDNLYASEIEPSNIGFYGKYVIENYFLDFPNTPVEGAMLRANEFFK